MSTTDTKHLGYEFLLVFLNVHSLQLFSHHLPPTSYQQKCYGDVKINAENEKVLPLRLKPALFRFTDKCKI